MEVENTSSSKGLKRQMELGNSSTSTARQDKPEPENPFDGIGPHPSSSASALMKKRSWDVFINHRGCDTKHNLASIIYHALGLIRLRVFLDKEEMNLGDSIPEELKEAMRTAGVHIAIFSKRYAESTWCLAELSFMLKTSAPILPVFYHVQPSDLRWVAQGKGCYAHAFLQHEKKGRYSSSMLNEWKTALLNVSYISGCFLNNENNDEGMLLKTIVNSVLRVIKKEPLEVAKHPVGMDEMVEDFERSRQEYIENEQQVQIVGIVGFGGSGKTTLATELYNRKSSSINSSSFLCDVRDAASKNALHTKQKKLLDDLHIQTAPFDNVREGKGILGKRLTSLCVLIVLDDIDHEDQLDALLPPKESLRPGSLVIVTTREGDVLAKCGITSIYKMQPLQHLHAKQLFCWHAFLKPFPQIGFEELVENCLDVCHGLPLSLKVIGGQLYGKGYKDYWVSQLDKIRRILPREIKERLKVSYDALDEDDKEIFLDIACFFIGERRSLAIAVWDGSGWSGLYSWETLQNKCLVEVDEEDCIRMHDHLRDLGREIATTHSPSRFWLQRQNMDIQRGIPIRGMMVDHSPPAFKEHIERISNLGLELQLLSVTGNDFTQKFEQLSRSFLWLRWLKFEYRYLPWWLSLENIRVLELICPKRLETLWADAHAPKELRELVVKHALRFQSLPESISHLTHLKRLCLLSCVGLSSLPEEFFRLQSLEHLVLQQCCNLSSLPNRFGDLLNMRHIDLSGCSRLQVLPVSFKQLIHLQYLNLSQCRELVIESNILENITKLNVFKVSGCDKLQVLPHNITNQASLKELDFSHTTSLRELPASIGQLTKLEKLEIFNSPLLTSLPTEVTQLSNLRNLKIENCSLRELNFGGGLRFSSSLRELKEIYVRKTSVSSLCLHQVCCPSLETLSVEDCPSLVQIETLPTTLKFITLAECTMLESLCFRGGFQQLCNLQTLKVEECPIRELHFVKGLTSSLQELREIYISGTSLSRISLSTDCCPRLETLSVEDCPSLLQIEILPRSLKFITLARCTMLESLCSPGAFQQLCNLQNLNVEECPIKELRFGGGSSSSLRELREIYMNGTSVSRISLPQDSCPNLETLIVNDCPFLMQIETLPAALKFLTLAGCTMLEKLGLPGAFQQQCNLQILNVKECPIKELHFVRGSRLEELREISIRGTSVSRISLPHDCCPNLETLRVDFPSLMEIEMLPPALKFIQLTELTMQASVGLPGALECLSNLQTIEVGRYTSSCCYFGRQSAFSFSKHRKIYPRKTSVSRISLPFGRRSSSSLREHREQYLRNTSEYSISLPRDCCPKLETLHVRGCAYLMKIETLPTSVKFIKLSDCTMLESIGLSEAFEQLSNLQTLQIDRCSVRELPFGKGSSSSLFNLRRIHLNATHLSSVSISQECCPSLRELQIGNEDYLMEIKTLPAALKSISFCSCKMLKNIRGIQAVVNVQELSLSNCPELDEMPCLEALVSLDKFHVRNCDKIKKIEGLEHLTSLEKLSVETCWMVPGIDSLGRTERLRMLNLKVGNISALEPFIQSIQIENWPWEMKISAGIFPHVDSILASFTFPGLTVAHSMEEYENHRAWLRLNCSETILSTAAIICFLVDSPDEDSLLCIFEEWCSLITLNKGKSIVITVFRDVYRLIEKGGHFFRASMFLWDDDDWWETEIMDGWIIVGERGSVLKALKRLSKLFARRRL